MKNFCSITVNNERLKLFSSKQFNPVVGALKGYEDCFFKFVNRGVLVESTPVIHQNRGPNAEIKLALFDGNPLFYAKVDNESKTFSKCKNRVFETRDGFKIRDAKSEVVKNFEYKRLGSRWYQVGRESNSSYESLESAKNQGLLDVYNELLVIERNAR